MEGHLRDDGVRDRSVRGRRERYRGHPPQDVVSGPELGATLLMSTGLTFGTISSLYGLNAGILDRAQFSVLVTVVVASAVIPTIIAQRWFQPAEAPLGRSPSTEPSRE